MGTLLDQLPRHQRDVKLDEFLSEKLDLAVKHKVSISDVIAASQALEYKRRNDLFVDDGNAFDEQIGGIGELLQKLCSNVDGLKKSESYPLAHCAEWLAVRTARTLLGDTVQIPDLRIRRTRTSASRESASESV